MCHLKQIGKVKKFDKRALHEVKSLSRVRLFATPWTVAYRPWDSPGRNTAVGCHFFLQEIFPTQGSNLCLPYCRRMLYHVSHQDASWTDRKSKNCHFEVLSSLILCNNNKPFLDQIVTCNERWILYDSQWWPAQWLEPEDAPKHFPKANLHQKKKKKKVVVTAC